MSDPRRKNKVIIEFIVLIVLVAVAIAVIAAVQKNGKKGSSAAQDASAYRAEANISVSPASTDETAASQTQSGVTAEPTQSSGPAAATETSSVPSSGSVSEQTEPAPQPEPEITEEPLPEVWIELDESALYSDYVLFIRRADQKVLFDRNGYETMYPASMTKIMTAVVVLENLLNMDMRVDVWQEDSDMLYTDDASVAGFLPGESVSVRDLLYGVMLPSGADACKALARAVAGSEEEFVNMMNNKAYQLGMMNTHFMNCTGLHDDNHYSTCHDMAILLSYALNDESFRIISGTPEWVCEPTEHHPDGLYLASTLSGIEGLWLENGAEIVGGKTGTEDEAGRCLASYGFYNGQEFLLVTGHAPSDETGNLWDAMTMFESLR